MSDFTLQEMMVLAGDMEHAPMCEAQYHEVFYQDDAGNYWADETCTVPWVEKECTCGYFAALRSGQDKMRALAEAA